MRFVTFNLRCDYQQDGANCFCYRQPMILRVIEREKPDVLCFQEVLPHMERWLKEHLSEYYLIGCGRGEDLDGEQGTIAFRKERYQLLAMSTFWLSETPTLPGSRYPDQSICPRTCTDAVLMDENSGFIFRVMNTHLDHEGEKARELGIRQILRQADTERFFSDAPLILAGDFNAAPDSMEMKPLLEHAGLTILTRDIGVTYHGYGCAEHPSQIDYIVLRGPLYCTGIRKWTDEENGVYLSDHYPVCAEIRWRMGNGKPGRS